jgi:hypothetical protein
MLCGILVDAATGYPLFTQSRRALLGEGRDMQMRVEATGVGGGGITAWTDGATRHRRVSYVG